MADDGIKLTNDEVRELTEGGVLPSGHKAVVSIVAARVQELTAERDNFEANCAHWMKSYEQQTEFARQMTGERDAARAELAAANTRIAELEGSRDILREIEERRNDEAFMERIRNRVAEDADLLERIGEDELFVADLRAQLAHTQATNAALSARLERVRALADTTESLTHMEFMGKPFPPAVTLTDLRAALGEDA